MAKKSGETAKTEGRNGTNYQLRRIFIFLFLLLLRGWSSGFAHDAQKIIKLKTDNARLSAHKHPINGRCAILKKRSTSKCTEHSNLNGHGRISRRI